MESLVFDGDTYELCSIASSNETASDIVGHGRLLGKLYTFLGHRLESGIGNAAEKLGYGPRMTAKKIKQLCEDKTLTVDTRCRAIRKKCKRLDRYLRSDLPSTQEQALEIVIELAVYDSSIREMLKAVTGYTVSMLQYHPHFWVSMNTSLRTRAARALISLSDNRINCLIQCICHAPLGARIENYEMELSSYLVDPDYSFLVLRHFRQNRDSFRFQHIIEKNAKLLSDMIASLENAEWAEIDSILEVLTEKLLRGMKQFASLINVLLRNAGKLPKVLEKIKIWISDLQSEHPVRVLCSYTILGVFVLEISNAEESGYHYYEHPNLSPLQQRLSSPPDLAFSIVCAHYSNCDRTQKQRLFEESLMQLSQYIDSDNEETRSRALANFRIMMISGSLLRWKALNVLSTTRFIQTTEFTALVDYTASRFFPRSHHLDNHGYCPFSLENEEYYRHCDKDGQLIHLSAESLCNGECGGTEEHELQYNMDQIVMLVVHPDEPITFEDQYPLIAGYKGDGTPLVVLEIDCQCGQCSMNPLAVEYGFNTADLQIKHHYFKGEPRIIRRSASCDIMVPVLRFDADVYPPSKHAHGGGMDPTGPFHWRFSKKLPSPVAAFSEELRRFSLRRKAMWSEPYTGPETNEQTHVSSPGRMLSDTPERNGFWFGNARSRHHSNKFV